MNNLKYYYFSPNMDTREPFSTSEQAKSQGITALGLALEEVVAKIQKEKYEQIVSNSAIRCKEHQIKNCDCNRNCNRNCNCTCGRDEKKE